MRMRSRTTYFDQYLWAAICDRLFNVWAETATSKHAPRERAGVAKRALKTSLVSAADIVLDRPGAGRESPRSKAESHGGDRQAVISLRVSRFSRHHNVHTGLRCPPTICGGGLGHPLIGVGVVAPKSARQQLPPARRGVRSWAERIITVT